MTKRKRESSGGEGSNLPSVVPNHPNVLLGGADITLPDFTAVISNPDLDLKTKRLAILRGLGVRKTKKKYSSVEEKKKAAKDRREKRREERDTALRQYGLAPKKRGPKKSEEEKKVARSQRGKRKRSALREAILANPSLAEKYGIDPNRYKPKKRG